jgi:hypothetical protein
MATIRQRDLFPARPVLDWFEDEIVFSLASRYHLISGNALSATTCRQLFGHSRLGSQHDFPCRIERFVARTAGTLGSPLSVIRDRTILPFYLPFRAPSDADLAYSSMCGDALGSLKYRLGIVTSRFRANHPLKACIECIADDMANCHLVYWHREHQLPGVWICPFHEVPLLESRVKSTGVGRFLWHLPKIEELTPTTDMQGAESARGQTRGALLALARSSLALVGLRDGFHFDPQVLLTTYHSALVHLGLMHSGGGLKLHLIGPSFAAAVAPLRVIRELSALPATGDDAAEQAARLLREPRSGTHPLRHLGLILWLFGTWTEFWNAYEARRLSPKNESSAGARPQIGSYPNAIGNPREAALVKLLRDEGCSVSKAADYVGVDTATAMTWAARAGIATSRRPKLLKEPNRGHLIRDLKRGGEKPVLAEKYGISIQTVTTTLRTEVGLHDAWKAARLARASRTAQAELNSLAARRPSAGIKELRLLAPAAYAWLYRNNRAWLYDFRRARSSPARGNNVAVNWDARDQALAAQIREAALKLFKDMSGGKITLWRLYQALPELKAKLGALDHLPLTLRALQEVTTRRRHRVARDSLI